MTRTEYVLEGVTKPIRNHLETLLEADVVARVELPEEERTRNGPHVFYGLTAAGRSALEAAGLVTAEHVL